MVERYGMAKARKIGQVAMVGGKDKTKIRNATPLQFRDLLLSIARSEAAVPMPDNDLFLAAAAVA